MQRRIDVTAIGRFNGRMRTTWTADRVLDLAKCYRDACVLAGAVELDIFDAIGRDRLPPERVAQRTRCDVRALTVLLDALAALGLLGKKRGRYSVPRDVAAALTGDEPPSVLAMCQHHANCLRRWAQLARVVRTGQPAPRAASIRGAAKDRAAFIGGMHALNVRLAPALVRKLRLPGFRHLLDVGGGSGIWTMALLDANPCATATLFDLPPVIPMARRRLRAAGFTDRVRFVAGDFERDRLPRGADLAWVSAIVHQNSRAQNRALFRNVQQALVPGGWIAIRDVIMDRTRTSPTAGALFAVNMLVATSGGGTYTWPELCEDLRRAGFGAARRLRRGTGNDSVLLARRIERPSR